jgi:purine-binding chemotaxis protein CheW
MLVTRVGRVACAIPIEHVIETMRPLPVEPITRSGAESLALVQGLAMIRGAPVPVVDARMLLGVPGERGARFVVVRAGERRIALVVDEVIEVRAIGSTLQSRMPLLFDPAKHESVAAVGTLDAELLVVLDSARVLPEDSWRSLERSD